MKTKARPKTEAILLNHPVKSSPHQIEIINIVQIMKKIFLFITALYMSSFVFAQSNSEEVDLIQAAFGMEKKEIVAAFVTPEETQKEAFWKLYEEYETERTVLGKERIKLLNLYAEQYETLTSEEADAWTSKVMTLQQKNNKLIQSYYKKVKSISNGIVATQFYQIESYILTGIRMLLLDDMPFVMK